MTSSSVRSRDSLPTAVILVRAVFYGAGAGFVWASLFPAAILILDGETPGFFIIFAIWGAAVGAGVGLVLGITVVLGGASVRTDRRSWRLLMAAATVALVFATIWALGGNPTSWASLILAVPAGLAAWLLFPMVLRPETHEPLPPLRGEDGDHTSLGP